MKKVKEYLDKNLFSVRESSCKIKNNGHYCVGGSWEYPEKWYDNSNFDFESIIIKKQKIKRAIC